MDIKVNGEPVYDDNDEHIKTKIKIYGDQIQIFKAKKCQKKMHYTSFCH